MVGIDSPRTFKLIGKLEGAEVVVLVDSRATHNFIAQELVSKLGIMVHRKGFQVLLGNREYVKGKGVCREICLRLHGITVIRGFFAIQFG